MASYRIDPVGLFDDAGEVKRNVGITSIPAPPGAIYSMPYSRSFLKINDTEDVIGRTDSEHTRDSGGGLVKHIWLFSADDIK
jgi:hypothetical protein